MTVIKKNYSDEERKIWKKVQRNKAQVFIYEAKKEFYAIPIFIYVAVSSVLMALAFGGWTLFQIREVFETSSIETIYFMIGILGVMIMMGIVFFILGIICISWHHSGQNLYDEYQKEQEKAKTKKTRNY